MHSSNGVMLGNFPEMDYPDVTFESTAADDLATTILQSLLGRETDWCFKSIA